MTPEQIEAIQRAIARSPVSNQNWKLDEDGLLVAEMSAATLGGKEVIYGPWGEPISNTVLKTRYDGEGIEREVIGWDLTVTAPGGEFLPAYISNH